MGRRAVRKRAETGYGLPRGLRWALTPRSTAPFLVLDLRDPRLHQPPNKSNRQWLVRGEANGPFGSGEALKLIPEHPEDRGGWEQAAVVRKRGEPHQHPLVPKRGNSIADDFSGFRWGCGPDGRADLRQGAARWLRDSGKVFVNGSRRPNSSWPRPADSGFRLFHAGDDTRSLDSIPCLSLARRPTEGRAGRGGEMRPPPGGA